jgi:hypothetical protein
MFQVHWLDVPGMKGLMSEVFCDTCERPVNHYLHRPFPIRWLSLPQPMPHHADRPTKICPACGRPFQWRKKWKAVWEEVRYCSERCRRQGRKPGRGPSDAV